MLESCTAAFPKKRRDRRPMLWFIIIWKPLVRDRHCRRECLNHMLVLNQKHLNVITRDHVDSVSLIPATNGV